VIDADQESTAAKNARRRLRTLNLLISLKAQKSRKVASRLSRDRKHSIPWFLLDSFAPGSGVVSESQTQQFGMPASKVKFSSRDRLFIRKKSDVREFPESLGFVRRSSSSRG